MSETVQHVDGYGGVILIDGLWYPFSYFFDGEMDIAQDGYEDDCYAMEMYKRIFT